jgi:hypothetical protein
MSVTKLWNFMGGTQYIWNFISSFSIVVAPLHAIMASGKSFRWRKTWPNDFE